MIKAMIFDLDGTLVQTEKLKALSYAKAAVALCPYDLKEKEVIETFKEVVGRSRREVAATLVDRFQLAEKARALLAEFGVTEPWQAFVQVRLCYYQEMLSDPNIIRSNQWPFNLAFLRKADRIQCKVALAAGMHVVAVATPFTHRQLHASGLLPKERIVDDPLQVAAVVGWVIDQQAGL